MLCALSPRQGPPPAQPKRCTALCGCARFASLFERRDQLAILEVRDVGGFVDGLACGLCSLEQLTQLVLLCRHGVLIEFCWLRQKAEEGERSDVQRRGTGNTGAQAFGAGRPLNGAAG